MSDLPGREPCYTEKTKAVELQRPIDQSGCDNCGSWSWIYPRLSYKAGTETSAVQNHSEVRGNRALRFKCWILAAVALLGATSALAAGVKPLVIAEKNRVVANKDTYIILVLDLKPNLDYLIKDGSTATYVIVATAATYARDYLAKSEFN